MKELKDYFAEIGSKGGKKSKRALTPEQARAMVAAREAKKAAAARRNGQRGGRPKQQTKSK